MADTDKVADRRVPKRPALLILLAILLFVLSTGGFYGAYMLLSDISGAALGVPKTLLDHLPIDTFLLPGLFLLIFMGFLPLVTFVGMLRKNSISAFQRLAVFRRYHWSYTFAVINGILLAGWTIGELILWGINALSVIYFIWACVILLLCLIPKLKRWFALNA
jgi:hypothetical protein